MLTRRRPAPAALLAATLLLPILPWACSRNAPSLAPMSPDTGNAAVRVTFREAPLGGVRVELRSAPDESTGAAAGVTGPDGVASLDAPPGRYFLVAQWRGDSDYSRPIAPGDRYAYFGGNPVYVEKGGGREFFVGVEEFASPPAGVGEPAAGTGVAGRVAADGAPAEGASVYAYHRTESAFRDLGFAVSAPTAPDGSFVLDLPPGRYYILARRRAGG
ncbi:MAG TPA: carboxypeptidase-like regulatory domain-containing protein, partial [Candidatus Deferrimicrobiaceae bacterium]